MSPLPPLELLTSLRHSSDVHHRTATYTLLATAGVLFGLTHCAPYRVEYMEDALQQANQAELVHKFGYPQRLKRLKNGDQVWEYDFQGEERKCVTYAIVFNPEDTLRQWERRDCQKEPTPSRSRK